ncbi:MAG: hypothetical protein KJ041_10930, partial [Gammaproteobacteria bacterium]|nr:hypothetical protein [Gammaproteobacteria bacterium]
MNRCEARSSQGRGRQTPRLASMVAVLSVAALWIVAGCTGPAGGQGVTTATPSRSRLDVGLVPGAGKDLYFATVAAGMQLATSELGGTLTQAPP